MRVLFFPDAILREKSEEIKIFSDKTSDFISQLQLTMYANKGCVGIAAPQVGELKRIVIVDVSGHKKATEKNGLLVMINPVVLDYSGAVINREGCLSVPDYTGNVERADSIKVKFINIKGREQALNTSGFEAVVIQHEIDHLDGILFIDRIKNIRGDLFMRKKYGE